jgi:hypothetical protein
MKLHLVTKGKSAQWRLWKGDNMPDAVNICCKRKDKCGDGNVMDIHFYTYNPSAWGFKYNRNQEE